MLHTQKSRSESSVSRHTGVSSGPEAQAPSMWGVGFNQVQKDTQTQTGVS